jgi:hypothetical protein
MPNLLLIELLKISLICGFCSLIGWIVLYSVLAPWWKNPIGRTLVAKTLLVAAILVPSLLGLFFPTMNEVAAEWTDLVLISLITPVMIWRSAVWLRLYGQRKIGNSNATDMEEGEEEVDDSGEYSTSP